MAEQTTSPEDQAKAASLRQQGEESQGRNVAKGVDGWEGLPQLKIDEGRFKYVLIQINTRGDKPEYLVRGDASCGYHADVAERVIPQLDDRNIPFRVLGGGRMQHEPASKTLHIYGHSIGFPWQGGVFRHDITAGVCAANLPPDYTITTSNEGY